MVTLPKPFVATRYPGYFWHLEKQVLFSLKVGGELRELVLCRKSIWCPEDAYHISHLGQRQFMTLAYLKALTDADSEIPIGIRSIPEPTKPTKRHYAKSFYHQSNHRYTNTKSA